LILFKEIQKMKKTPPRKVPDKDDFYMAMAFWASSRSKDPNTQVGAVIVDDKNVPLGWGYNGLPRNIKDHEISWSRPEKYPYIIHAEINAIDHSYGELSQATLYVTALPCKSCMLRLVSYNMKRVVYFDYKSDKNSSLNSNDIEIAKEIARLGMMTLIKYEGNLNWMRDRIKTMEQIGVFE